MAEVTLGSEGDPGCIFFTLNKYQATLLVTICDQIAGIGSVTGRDLRTDRRECLNRYVDM